MFKKNPEKTPKIKVEKVKKVKPEKVKKEKKPKERNKDGKPLNIKKILIPIGIVLLVSVIVGGVILVLSSNNDNDDILPPVISEEEKYANDLKLQLSSGLIVGTTTKDEIVSSGIVDMDKSGDSYLIKKDYTTIDNNEFFTTFLIKDNILVGVVNEAMLDTETKYNLATKFQSVASNLNKAYPNIEVSRRWFAETVKYDSNIWNEMIVNNELELIAELAKDSEFVKLIVSGVPYFDYLYNNKYDQSFGNLVIIYSNGANQELFKDIDKINVE